MAVKVNLTVEENTIDEAKATLRKIRLAKLLKIGAIVVESDTARLTYKALKSATKQNIALYAAGVAVEVISAVALSAIADEILDSTVGISEASANKICSDYEKELRVKVAIDKALKKRAAKREKEVATV